MQYKCYGKMSWRDTEQHLFDYRIFAGIAPQTGDTILISEREMEEEGLTSPTWIIEGRRWCDGNLELVIAPPSDGLVLA